MPNIQTINGIKINVYPNDHVPPHIHAIYGEYEALIGITTLETLRGYLPKAQLQTVHNFIAENRDELLHLFYKLNPNSKKK
jgi:hypothetical protein